MKVTIIFLISSLMIIALAQIFMSNYTSQTEQHKYQIIKKYDKFEVRKYEPALFSSVKLEKNSYRESSNEGFKILAGYIFGNNEANEKIAMTSPVAMELGDSTKMLFMVPNSRELKDLPTPKNSKIVFEKHEEKIFAAIQFGGWANDEKIEKYRLILKNELEKEELTSTNKYTFLGYNPPYEVLNRRNEVITELMNFK
jgi:hypothetical protein